MAENVTKFSAEELCREIVPATLKQRARVDYVKKGGEELRRTKAEAIELLETIFRGIEIEIKVKEYKGAPLIITMTPAKTLINLKAGATAALIKHPSCAAFPVITIPGRSALIIRCQETTRDQTGTKMATICLAVGRKY